MSRRSLHLPVLYLSFLNESACEATINLACELSSDDRPFKRRKIDADQDFGWAAVLEFHIDCQFLDLSNSICFESDKIIGFGIPIEARLKFDEPIFTVLTSDNELPLFAFVCNDSGVGELRQICRIDSVVRRHPSFSQCLRNSITVSFRKYKDQIARASLEIRIDARFDKHLALAEKLSIRDRLEVLNYAFGRKHDSIHAEDFYAQIGRLPKDYVAGQEKAFQHPDLRCQLFPFQARAVAWMLRREGSNFPAIRQSSLSESQLTRSSGQALSPLWDTVSDLKNRTMYLNRHQGFLSTDREWVSTTFPQSDIYGGVLAEVFRPVVIS